MDCSRDEWDLLQRLTKPLSDRFGPYLIIWAFTATFTSFGTWVARMDYTAGREETVDRMRGALLDGQGIEFSVVQVRPRIFFQRRSIAVLREGLIELELESPDLGERVI